MADWMEVQQRGEGRRMESTLRAGRAGAAARLPGACANAASRRGSSEHAHTRAGEGLLGACANAPPALQPRPAGAALPEVRRGRAWGLRDRPVGSRHVARHVVECLASSTLEPPASVAEAVSSLTIADAFIASGESPAPLPRAPAQRFICSFPDCSAGYNKAWKLDAHLCKHTGERPFVCDHEGCGKAFIRDYHLSRHALIHTGEKPFVCTASGCDQKFNTKSNLKKHFERKHENQQKQYVCSFEGCKKTFKKHQQLKIHQCQHTKEPPFKCTHEGCGKHFASPSSLKRHGKVHEGYICQKECSFVANTWTELLKHVRETHKEDITCDVCQKTFKRKDFLKQHMRTHAPERDVCRCPRDGCGRTYTTVFNLQSHILSFHEERRPFVCEHAGCGKTFAMKQSLGRHAVVHDPDKKKMKLKVRPSREKRSLASRLSGYIPPKRTHNQGVSLPRNGESLNGTEGKVPSTVATPAPSYTPDCCA
ncbi:transcription factor IIIA [Hippopotamus amphibius kiboko]|uniref:transcription factor IIIA n=1 Tax=Hippopotamus amphibius kiboko TaxID=575201 RepID=UPI002596EF3A|nr:transcription factor IIIA [Hippopotamus amphibius kiboko]